MIAYYVFAMAVGVVIFLMLDIFGATNTIDVDNGLLSNKIVEWLLGFLIVVTYYTITEYFFKGKTLGKLITKTRAVTVDHKRMDFGTTFKRSLCRIVPFEQFSFLGDQSNGWHDRWSDTIVIEDEHWEDF